MQDELAREPGPGGGGWLSMERWRDEEEEGVEVVGWAGDSRGPARFVARFRGFTQQCLARGRCSVTTCCGLPRRGY